MIPADERFQAWLNLLQTYSVVTGRMEARMEAAVGLSLPEHEVLVRLYDAPGRALKMVDLSAYVLLTKSGVTRLVDRLETRGLVARETAPADRRIVLARLTDEGVVVVEASEPVLASALHEVFSTHLSDPDVASLLRGFRKVLEGNGEHALERCSTVRGDAAVTTPA